MLYLQLCSVYRPRYVSIAVNRESGRLEEAAAAYCKELLQTLERLRNLTNEVRIDTQTRNLSNDSQMRNLYANPLSEYGEK
jgi:hypothetical protein